MGADHTDQHHGLKAWIKSASPGHWRVAVVRRPEGSQGCVLWPTRLGVDRPLAWLGRCRRHSQDDERRTDASEAMQHVYETRARFFIRRFVSRRRVGP
jgi:transposase